MRSHLGSCLGGLEPFLAGTHYTHFPGDASGIWCITNTLTLGHSFPWTCSQSQHCQYPPCPPLQDELALSPAWAETVFGLILGSISSEFTWNILLILPFPQLPDHPSSFLWFLTTNTICSLNGSVKHSEIFSWKNKFEIIKLSQLIFS